VTSARNIEERRKALAERLNQLGVYMIGDDPEDWIEQIEKLLDETSTMEEMARRKVVGDVLKDRSEASYNRRVRAVNDILLPLGRCVSPAYVPNGVLRDLLERCNKMSSAVAGGGDPSADITWIVKQIAQVYFMPHVRAFMAVRAKRLPCLELVAHYLDDAAMAFYRRNYFACANGLTTAVERLLLEHVGWTFGQPNMHHPDIRAAVAALAPQSCNAHMDARFQTYKQYVLQFLEEYQKPSRVANLSVSRFNRAFIQHVNDAASYYTYDDCVTAFQFFDLYVEFVATQVGKELYALIPETDAEMNLRSNHYWSLILEDWLHGSAPSAERAILESDPRFQTEAADTNLLSLYDSGPEQNRVIGAALLALGIRSLGDILSLVREPVDAERLGHLGKLTLSLAALMAPSSQTPTTPPTDSNI
jgi:hypothetical protein